MIPYPYNMVDMQGIDLAEANGVVLPGIYSEILEAANACGDIVLYNWKFASIEIAPQHTSILIGESSLLINGVVQVTEQDVVQLITIDPPEPPDPIPLTVTENGIYVSSRGYSPVTVQVPSQPGVIVGNILPSEDIGEDGDYYRYNAPAPIILGIRIVHAARGTNYNFNYWNARDIQIVFEDLNGNDVSIKDIQGAECYWAAGTSAFTSQNGVINGQTGTVYEHSGLPGYWKFRLPESVRGYKVKQLRILLRDNSSYRDFYEKFSFEIWAADREPIGDYLVDIEDSVQSDWSFTDYNDFSFTPVELNGTIPYFYEKINGEWILIK